MCVCVFSTISSNNISSVDWSSFHERDKPWCVCVLALYPYVTSQLTGLLYMNVTYPGVCVLSVLYPRMTSQLTGPLYTNVTNLGVCVCCQYYILV